MKKKSISNFFLLIEPEVAYIPWSESEIWAARVSIDYVSSHDIFQLKKQKPDSNLLRKCFSIFPASIKKLVAAWSIEYYSGSEFDAEEYSDWSMEKYDRKAITASGM